MPIGIKLPLADHLGDLVWAVDLAQTGERPKDLKCVECSEPVLLRHGEQRQPHFAHRVAVGCTAGESALHRSAIRVIVDGILRAASDGRTYPFPIVCEFCDASRLGNLSRTVGLSIEIDRHLTDAVRPDILVRTADGSPAFAVEVIVTHEPEEGALSAYRSLDIPVIAVYPSWETLEGLRTGLDHLTPRQGFEVVGAVGLMSRCRFPRHLEPEDAEPRPCPVCAVESRVVTAEVATGQCWSPQCGGRVRVLDVYAIDRGKRVLIAAGASDLTGIAKIARELGVQLGYRNSKPTGTSYFMNICACGAPSGDNYVYDGALGEKYVPSVTDLVGRYIVCRAGHWTHLTTKDWPVDVVLGRPSWGRGLCGSQAGLLVTDQEQPVSEQHISDPAATTKYLARVMAWGNRGRF
jgi:hypothetical protein